MLRHIQRVMFAGSLIAIGGEFIAAWRCRDVAPAYLSTDSLIQQEAAHSAGRVNGQVFDESQIGNGPNTRDLLQD